MAYVITDDCVMCGACADACPVEAISEGDGKYVSTLMFVQNAEHVLLNVQTKLSLKLN